MQKPPLAVILAGGEGKRFKPLVTNKTVFPFLGKPLIKHNLEMLSRTGFQEVLIATNPENNHELVDKFEIDGLKIHTVQQSQPLGMSDALLALESEIKDRPIMVMNAVDVVEDQLLVDLLVKTETSEVVVAGMEVDHYFPGGYLETDGDRVLSIIEKPGAGNEPSNLVNLVFHYFAQPKTFLEILKTTTSEEDDIYEVALAELMKQEQVSFIKYHGAWTKLKYPHMVLDMTEFMLEKSLEPKIDSSAQVSDKAHLEGPIYIGPGAKVYEYAVIKGPAYIGADVVVGNHSLIIRSMIESGSVIGAHSEVTRSYIGPDCSLHHNFVGDSVLEAEVNPSYGTCFANLRLDKENVRYQVESDTVETNRKKLGSIMAKGVFSGINCSFMPGTVIKSGKQVMPGSLIKGYQD